MWDPSDPIEPGTMNEEILFPPGYTPFFSIQTFVSVIIPVFAFFIMFAVVIFMMYVYRKLCTQSPVFEHILCEDDDFLPIPRPITPSPEHFRRNSAQAHYRLLIKNKFEKEFGKSRAESGLLMPVRLITPVIEDV
ncbi:unnamed protein product [Caenorhabditis bovis]|uniref:Uncharacterized protein n=1 Tax=Caenorhabditis bovis TaxID=2654633 RepID=A0A8S1F7P1_9PELO|nr:unnamed protein product [Caenorhabditis bovis]